MMHNQFVFTALAAALCAAHLFADDRPDRARGAAMPPSARDQAALDEILGSRAVAWKLTQPGSVEKLDNRTVLCSGSQALTLSGSELFPVDVEYRLVFRLIPPSGVAGASVFFQIGLKGPADSNPTPPGVLLRGAPNASRVTWHVSGGPKGWRIYGDYILKAVTTPSLAWPEALRKSVERDMAKLPDLNHKWLTLRCVVRKNSIQTYLDDRLLDIRNQNDLDPSGSVRLILSPHVAVAALRVRPVPPDDPVYRPISIGGLFNAAMLNGRPLDRGTLPSPDEVTRVGNVPFVFAAPDDLGNDHISIAGSWAQFGSLETCVMSSGGEFGGRWPTALTVNPARIQFRAPNDHYVRLHLIAAASDERDSVPLVTAQFYKALSGYPESFGARVPLFSAKPSAVVRLPVKLQGGKDGCLYLVTIELDPGRLSALGKLPSMEKETNAPAHPRGWKGSLPILEVELTKEVRQYRSYPDPICYSYHQAGLPSSVHVYAVTLERAPLRLAFEPDKFGHVWTVPAVPAYTVTLGNRTAAPRAVELTLSTVSHDGSEKTAQTRSVTVVPGDRDTPVRFMIANLKRFGYHDVVLTLKDGAQTWVERRSLARLAQDTRERGAWEDGRGPLLGAWQWGGGHDTPALLQEMQVMAEAGAEVLPHPFFSNTPPDVVSFAEQHHMVSFDLFNGHAKYALQFAGMKWDPATPRENSAALLKTLKDMEAKPGLVNQCRLVPFFAEPGLGPITYGNLPEYYGEPEHAFTPDEDKRFKEFLAKFLLGANLIRKEWPNARILLPHGDPGFCIPFLRHSEEVRRLIDGIGLDMPGFERMPEMQLHQVAQHRLYQIVNEFRKYGKKPLFDMVEGMCVPSQPGSLTWDEQADVLTRSFLIFFAYGVYRLPACNAAFDCANYWGEVHYGGGWCSRLPYAAPKPAYAAYATLSRHLNRANFEKWLPTGSGSTYALQFKHYKTGKLIHVFWTIRGKRPVSIAVPKGAVVTAFDEDDNPTSLAEKDGQVRFTVNSSPCYVEGLTGNPAITLGQPDHSDATLRSSEASSLQSTSFRSAQETVKLGNLGDGSWKVLEERDLLYENNNPLQIVRFPGKMSVATVPVSEERGGPASQPYAAAGKALAVRLEQQAKERKVMPYYTTLVPARPIEIPGKASHLGLWVHAASDWGRVVYCLRDAKGQRWTSIGTKEQWNCDDIHQWSVFCFDGWRYLRFELPANAPYDNFRELGSTWWGHHGPGEGVVHLPLSIEKIIVERRTHIMYVNDIQPAKPDDVLLGDLMAEYASDFERSEDAVRQSRIRMPVSGSEAGLTNPIKDMEARGIGAAMPVTRIDPPAREYDGTRGLVYFNTSSNAVRTAKHPSRPHRSNLSSRTFSR